MLRVVKTGGHFVFTVRDNVQGVRPAAHGGRRKDGRRRRVDAGVRGSGRGPPRKRSDVLARVPPCQELAAF